MSAPDESPAAHLLSLAEGWLAYVQEARSEVEELADKARRGCAREAARASLQQARALREQIAALAPLVPDAPAPNAPLYMETLRHRLRLEQAEARIWARFSRSLDGDRLRADLDAVATLRELARWSEP